MRQNRGSRKFFNKAQGLVEYIVITAMVAIAGITILRVFRDDLKEAYTSVGQAIVSGVKTTAGANDGN